MRYLLLLAILALAGGAQADDKVKPAKTPAATPPSAAQESSVEAVTGSGNDTAQDRAQDHNSSRSNKSSAHLHQENIVHRDLAAREAKLSDFGMSRATEQRAEAADHNHSASGDGTAGSRPAEGADYNSSRSNKTHALAAPGDGGADSSGGTKAQDYNSSRSNTTTLREDDASDLDGDGRPDVVVCRQGVDDDCDDASHTGDPVMRNAKRPRQ